MLLSSIWVFLDRYTDFAAVSLSYFLWRFTCFPTIKNFLQKERCSVCKWWCCVIFGLSIEQYFKFFTKNCTNRNEKTQWVCLTFCSLFISYTNLHVPVTIFTTWKQNTSGTHLSCKTQKDNDGQVQPSVSKWCKDSSSCSNIKGQSVLSEDNTTT